MSTTNKLRLGSLVLRAFILTAAFSLSSCGGGDGGTAPTGSTPATPVPTAAGTPIGEPVTKTIGAAGGSLSSAGTSAVTVTIPAGALAGDRVVGIQPITSEAPGAIGTAFRLSPEGASFSVPVQVTFKYTNEDLKGSTPEAFGITYQDSDGVWRAMKEVNHDKVAKTLTISTTHFSDWSKFSGWQILPHEATITPGKTIVLTVMDCEPVEDNGVTSLKSQCLSDGLLAPMLSGWAVNGIAGGDKGVGYITGSGNTAVYRAPEGGAQETYSVSVELVTKTKDKVLLVSNITVVSPGTWIGTTTWSGAGSDSIHFQVKWLHDRSVDSLVYYRPEGLLSVDNLVPCASYSNSTATIVPTDGELIIDLSKSPPSYIASAVTKFSTTISDLCGNTPDQHFDMDFSWMPASGTTSAGGNEIAGSQTFEAGQTLTWSYIRQE